VLPIAKTQSACVPRTSRSSSLDVSVCPNYHGQPTLRRVDSVAQCSQMSFAELKARFSPATVTGDLKTDQIRVTHKKRQTRRRDPRQRPVAVDEVLHTSAVPIARDQLGLTHEEPFELTVQRRRRTRQLDLDCDAVASTKPSCSIVRC